MGKPELWVWTSPHGRVKGPVGLWSQLAQGRARAAPVSEEAGDHCGPWG